MSNITLPLPSCSPLSLQGTISFEDARTLRDELIWRNLQSITIQQALEEWLTSLSSLTAKNYRSGMDALSALGIIIPSATLQMFALVNHDDVIDHIKRIAHLSEASKQARAACYISFTRFLSRRTQGIINKAIPSREGTAKTFYKVREKVATEAMTRAQWSSFLQELYHINKRDCLIAKIILQGGKRVSEVLSLTTDRINQAQCEITFTQSKTKGYEQETVITYPKLIVDELLAYIGK